MRIVFAAGGTGGHINPALAVAGELRRRDPATKILFVGTREKMESKLVPAAGFDFLNIEITGFHRKLSAQNIKLNLMTLAKILKASSQARTILHDFNPDVVVGFGGYVSGPVVRTAAKMGIKTAIHEQNAYPGIANKALAKIADRTMLTTEKAAEHLSCKHEPIVTGLPIRGEILTADRAFSRAELRLDERPMILSTGGSLGARVFNQAIVDLITAMHSSGECTFIHAHGQAGAWVPEKLRENGVDLEKEKHVVVKEYIYDMPRCLAAADIIINRAGASTLTEIEAQGIASILIPSPNVTENHQYHNAMDLVRHDAAIMIEEKDLTPEFLAATVKDLLADKEKRERIGANAKKMLVPDAQKKIADELIKLAQSK
ncbi:MAG: undecaprenyldiphospho-muramoylpentapeptide beta-N-acetylglucosaminyltransferase [Oscillospiraceae bacterium]|jgi:UDP-N-acetylglucosamine--N-acetylmuramyl-(pentapeptide) pyrophosphoryl-undecaprenol N-acetylglucosamine transferase|nr:undecaprenyldiphospho-muramoylpentapeptide beta-N-acetylglucosaminyltransferase [Oscillospiraceae bacterium]